MGLDRRSLFVCFFLHCTGFMKFFSLFLLVFYFHKIYSSFLLQYNKYFFLQLQMSHFSRNLRDVFTVFRCYLYNLWDTLQIFLLLTTLFNYYYYNLTRHVHKKRRQLHNLWTFALEILSEMYWFACGESLLTWARSSKVQFAPQSCI